VSTAAGAAPGDAGRGPTIAAVVALLASMLVIGLVRPRAAASVAAVREESDSYPLPPPDQLEVVSLGYRSAAADLIWAYVMVAQGLRLSQHRRFEHGERYFQSIFALEPTYRRPYLLLDTILTFGSTKGTPEDAWAARRLFEFGLAQRPTDAQLHVQAGSFMAYLAPGLLPESEHQAWRLAGANLLLRAAELGATEATTWSGLAGVAVLNRNGQREAAIAYLERVFEINEDPAIRNEIARQLRGLKGEETLDRAQASARRFETAWRSDLPFISRPMMLLVGPAADPAACAGAGHGAEVACARDWRSWTERGTKNPK
jgi:tetratricopeptide (TPR) repeat protein